MLLYSRYQNIRQLRGAFGKCVKLEFFQLVLIFKSSFSLSLSLNLSRYLYTVLTVLPTGLRVRLPKRHHLKILLKPNYLK